MLSKNQIKLITSLQQKKYRFKHGLFIVEGIKGVNEFLDSDFELYKLYTTNENLIEKSLESIELISEKELKKISTLSNPNKMLGIFKIPEQKEIQSKGLILALDSINDPGNLGTIIRLCDWFDLNQIICSKDTVDCYNSKVVQSTMGSLTRVNINYVDDLANSLINLKLPIMGAFMEGKTVYEAELPKEAILIMGNEANGINQTIEKIISKKITIPKFGKIQKTESLNVATATAILLNEFKRVIFTQK